MKSKNEKRNTQTKGECTRKEEGRWTIKEIPPRVFGCRVLYRVTVRRDSLGVPERLEGWKGGVEVRDGFFNFKEIDGL